MRKPKRPPIIREDRTIEIPIARGYVAVVDWEDAWVLYRTWTATSGVDRHVYAVSGEFRLHRCVLNLRKNDKRIADHKDGDTLNCRRSNLRVVTPLENSRNHKLFKNNTSGYTGVFWHKREQRWRARLQKRHLGAFKTAEEAHEARLKAELEEWGIHPQREYAFG